MTPPVGGRVMSMQLANCSTSHSRVPEKASIHDRTYYTTNKDHLYRAFEEISLHVQAHTQAELAHATSMYPQRTDGSSSTRS